MLRAHDLVAAAGYFGDGAGELGLQLRNFQNRQRLPPVHAVADVDVDVADEAGDFGMDIDDLVGLKLSGQGEHLFDIAALHHGHLRRGRARRGLDCRRAAMTITNQHHHHDRDSEGGDEDPKTFAHVRKLPSCALKAPGLIGRLTGKGRAGVLAAPSFWGGCAAAGAYLDED